MFMMTAEYFDSLTKIFTKNQGLSIKQLVFLKTVIFYIDFFYSDGNKVKSLQLPVPTTLQVPDIPSSKYTRNSTSVLLRAALALKQGNTDMLVKFQDNLDSILNTSRQHTVFYARHHFMLFNRKNKQPLSNLPFLKRLAVIHTYIQNYIL